MKVVTIPVPKVKVNEILIQVQCIALNPVESEGTLIVLISVSS